MVRSSAGRVEKRGDDSCGFMWWEGLLRMRVRAVGLEALWWRRRRWR